MANTLFDKVWDSHVVRKVTDGPDVFFIDRHFIHEVTSPVAFLGLKRYYNEDVMTYYEQKPYYHKKSQAEREYEEKHK